MPPLELDDLFPGEKKPKVKVVGLKKKETFRESRVAMHKAKKREARKENADYGKRIHKIQRVKPLRPAARPRTRPSSTPASYSAR